MLRLGRSVALRDDEVVDSDFLSIVLGHAVEELMNQVMKIRFPHGVEVVFSVPSRLDEMRVAEERKMMADRGLALLEPFAESGDIEFPLLGEVEQDLESGFVGKQFEDLDEVLLESLRQFREPRLRVRRLGGRRDRRNHRVLAFVGRGRGLDFLLRLAPYARIRVVRKSV